MKRQTPLRTTAGLLFVLLVVVGCSTPLDIEVSTDDGSTDVAEQTETTDTTQQADTTEQTEDTTTSEAAEVDPFTITVDGTRAEPDDVVFKLTTWDNPPSPRSLATSVPMVALYGDGRLIFDDDGDATVGFASISELWLTQQGIEELVAMANDVAANPGERDESLSDGESTVLTAGSVQVSFHNRGYQELLTFARTAPDELVVDGPQPVDHDRVLLIAWGGKTPSSDTTPNLPVDLTTGSSHSTRGGAVRCLDMTGDEFEALTLNLEEPAPSSPNSWSIDGWTYRVFFRPLFTGETGCATLEEL